MCYLMFYYDNFSLYLPLPSDVCVKSFSNGDEECVSLDMTVLRSNNGRCFNVLLIKLGANICNEL
jgi:hypothetical protein